MSRTPLLAISLLLLASFSAANEATPENPGTIQSFLTEQQPSAAVKASYAKNRSKMPFYPIPARERGQEGSVTIKVLINADGLVSTTYLASSSGYESLDNAALAAVAQWQFNPAQDDSGKAVNSAMLVPIRFSLPDFRAFLDNDCKDAMAAVTRKRIFKPDTPLWEIGPFKKSLELGAGYMKLNNAPAEKREAFWEEAGSMLDAMAATCTANPDWEFRKVLSQHMGKYLPYLYAPPFAKKR